MGSDKSLLDYNGMPQREYLFALLKECCHEVFVSCRKDQDVPDHFNPLVDHFHVPGPLNGILSAFSSKPESAWLMVAVDMPFVRAATFQLLINNRDQNKMATCFYNTETQQPEPLLTLWEAEAYPLLLQFVEKGNISPREFLKSVPVTMIHPPDEKTLINVNYPRDL
jgi:molybdopterin-guanine dinucleotide biosynthesis protein A